MKCMHNNQEIFKKIILLAIISHLTRSLKAHSTIHQAQEYPSGNAYTAALEKSKKESQEQLRAQWATTLACLLATQGPPRQLAELSVASLPEHGCCLPKLPPSSQSHLARTAPHSPHGLQATLPRHGLRLGS